MNALSRHRHRYRYRHNRYNRYNRYGRYGRGRGRGPVRNVMLIVTVLAGVVAVAGVVIVVTITRGGGQPGTTRPTGNVADGLCEHITVPAYFSPQYWTQATNSTPPPTTMILDISGVGAGSAPDPELQSLVSQAKAAGITILGYSSTVDGQRPIAQVEADVRDYAAWYGVTSIFLDRVSGQPAQVRYYQQLANYIHQAHQGSQVWLNPGVYPDQAYMSIGDVVMVFEGTYAQYLTASVPGWVRNYPASKFAHTIFATPGADLSSALSLAQSRNAGYVYVTNVTDGTGNPYDALPSYWSTEDASATAAC